MAKEKSGARDKTAQQELGSAWIMRRALKDNKRYKSVTDIVNYPKYPELLKLYPDLADTKGKAFKEWLPAYYKQQKKMLEEFSGAQFTEFTRDGGFMSFTTNLVKTKFGISKKDTWDPADLWCVQNESLTIAGIENWMKKRKHIEIEELNAYLRTLFIKRKVVGISLKKIAQEQAYYEEVNVKDVEFKDEHKPEFNISSMKLNLAIKPPTALNTKVLQPCTFAVDGASMHVDAERNGHPFTYTMQWNNLSIHNKKFGNITINGSISYARGAQLGSAPVDILQEICNKYGVKWSNNHNDYPKTAASYAPQAKAYEKRFTGIKAKGVQTGIVQAKKFTEYLNAVFKFNAPAATNKLMQVTFFYELTRLSKDDQNSMMTEIIFSAQKKGKGFGPFGKLY